MMKGLEHTYFDIYPALDLHIFMKQKWYNYL